MSGADWDNLPDLVLTNVFKHLEDLHDRNRASRVSKTWSRAFKSPDIWHKMKFYCWTIDNMIPVKFVQRFGKHLRELKMECGFSYLNVGLDKIDSSICDYFFRFFTISTQKQMNLEKFTFRNLDLTNNRNNKKWDKDLKRNMLGVIRYFLATQTNLVHLDLEFCHAPLEMGIDLLNKLANPGRIRNLYLEDFFEWDWECNVLTFPNYHDVIGSFKSLVRLTINYGYIDSNVLELIVDNCSRSLEVIEITCSEGTDVNRIIPNETWAWVKKKCSQLKVDVRFRHKDLDPDRCHVTHVIPAEMGLHSFIVDGGYCDRSHLEPLLIQLCQFRETLEVVELSFETNGNVEDRHLIELVSSCRGLKRFHFAASCSIEAVKKISELQLKGTIDLSYCYFKMRYKKENDVLIKEIHQLNESIKERQGVQFNIEELSCYASYIQSLQNLIPNIMP